VPVFRLGSDPDEVRTATKKFALRSVARCYQALSSEIAELETHNSTKWWRKSPLSWSLWRASVPTTPPRC
jgi:hypothetical protein